jgi:hypothetical protein
MPAVKKIKICQLGSLFFKIVKFAIDLFTEKFSWKPQYSLTEWKQKQFRVMEVGSAALGFLILMGMTV